MTSEELCKRALDKAGSMNELAKATGIPRQTVRMWYSRGAQPTWGNAYKLLQYLDLTIMPKTSCLVIGDDDGMRNLKRELRGMRYDPGEIRIFPQPMPFFDPELA